MTKHEYVSVELAMFIYVFTHKFSILKKKKIIIVSKF